MGKEKAGLLRNLATRTVIAALPVAMVGACASGLFASPPRLADYDYVPVAEISVSPTTVGIATSPLYGQTLAQINQQLDEMQAIGVQNIRVFVPWGLVEQVDDTYDWSHIDDIMNAAAARNMGVLAEVNATPVWAGPNPNAPGFPLGSDTPNVGAFTDFMRDFVDRYDETVSAYEIWNEPNYVQFSNPINPEAYSALLQAVYPVIKNLDPTATVVAGAVGTTQTSPFTMDPVQFVQRMLAAGAGNYFDALSVHPYGEEIAYSGSCPTCQPTVLTPREQVESIMTMLNGKKVWVTEYGLPTIPGGPFTEAQQAAWIKDLLDHWQTYDEDLVGPIFLYTGRDTPNADNPTNPHDYYGLWTQAGAMKAAAEMLKAWLAANQPGGPGNPGDPGNPGNPGSPGNPIDPIAQFFAAVAQALAQAIAQAVANFFAQFAAPAPPATLVATPEVQGRLATLASATELADGTEPNLPAPDGDTPTEGDVSTDSAAEPIAVDVALAGPNAVEPVAVEPESMEPVAVEPDVADPAATQPDPGTTTESETAAEPATDGTAEDSGPKPSTGTPTSSGDTTPAEPTAGDASPNADEQDKPAKAGDSPGKRAGSDRATTRSERTSAAGPGKPDAGRGHERRTRSADGTAPKSGLVSAGAGATASDSGAEAEG